MLKQDEKDAIAKEFGPTEGEVELSGKVAAIEQANEILRAAGMATLTDVHVRMSAIMGSLNKVISHRELLWLRLHELSFAAQTSGGTAGRDDALVREIENAREVLKQVDDERTAPAGNRGVRAGASTYIGGIGPVMLTGGSGGAHPQAQWPNGVGGPGGSVVIGTIAHLNEPEPTFEHARGKVDPEQVRRALQYVQLRDGFGTGKVVPVWCRLIAAARYAIEDLQDALRQDRKWLTIAEMCGGSYEGWCWIVYKGRVVEAYRDHEYNYRFGKHSQHVYLSECITHVMAWPLPSAPEVKS